MLIKYWRQVKKRYAVLYLALLVVACSKKEDQSGGIYEPGKPPLGVKLNVAIAPLPANGPAGTTVTFTGSGLLAYKNKIVFNFSDQPAQIVDITDTTIKVIVPASASSGATSISIDDQVFFGPSFTVNGNVSIDPLYSATNGTNGTVVSALKLNDGRFILTGSFSIYNNMVSLVTNRIVLTDANGGADASFRFGNGSAGQIASIIPLSNQSNFIVGGSIYNYEKLNHFINNITKTTGNGAGDSVSVLTYNKNVLAVPSFNGGTNAPILKLFNSTAQIIAVGNFTHYLRRRYDQPTSPHTVNNVVFYGDSVIVDSTEIHQVIRFNADGSLDKTYHYNPASGQGQIGGNGAITGSFLQNDGKLVLVGAFTTFDGVQVGRMVRLNANGQIDNTFNIGSGANSNISSVTFNQITQKYVITGTFGTFNGMPCNGILMLNPDGSVDPTFVGKIFSNGFPSFARQLSNGLVIVSGGFLKYNNIRHPGFIILNSTGDYAPGYNTTGAFSGSINDIIEGSYQSGSKTIITALLLGGVNKFDGKVVNNITRIALTP